MAPNRQGPNIRVQIDGFKKLGHTYRSKKTGGQIKTEMSPKLNVPKI